MTTFQTPAAHPLIGLIGHKGAGKSTLAHYLGTDGGCAEVAFATPLKQIAEISNPWVIDSRQPRPRLLASLVAEKGWDYAKTFPDVRGYLQTLGDGIRAVDPNFFVRRAMTTVAALVEWYPVVVSDVRRRNEAQAILDLGGILVRVVRDSADSEAATRDPHITEHDLDDWPVSLVIDNNGPLWELHAAVSGLMAAATVYCSTGMLNDSLTPMPLD